MATATTTSREPTVAAPRSSRSAPARSSPARRTPSPSPAARRPGSEPLLAPIRRRLESSFGARLDSVQVQRHPAAAAALGARAFAFGPNIVLGDGARPDDLPLMAHETAHTIQQRDGSRPQSWIASGGDAHEREAQRASEAAVRGEPFTVTGRTQPTVQRLGLSDALNYFADKANLIPGFRMFTIILGVNPINMSSVERSAANIMRAIVEFIPGGGLITQALDNHGVFEKVGNWVEQQISTLGMAGSAIKQAVTEFLGTLGWSDIFDLGGVWNRAKRIFTEPIDRIISFAKGLITGIVTFIKDAILKPIAKLAEGTNGYALLKAVMGKDPITGDPVPQTAEAIIGPFMALIGQEEIWENMKKANAIPRAFAWFKTALKELMGFVNEIPGLFITAFKSLQLVDIILVPLAFGKLVKVFGGFVVRFISWAGGTIWNLLEIIFAVVAPGVMPYIAKARAAFKTILKDPIAFVGNLVRAGKLGFEKFAANIVTHLKNALIKWLTGPLGTAGVYIPKSFDLMEIIKLVLSVLGLTWQNIRGKLVKIIPDPVLTGLEKTAGILVTLVKDGPVAAWDQIKTELNELKSQLISQVTQMITVEVVKAAVIKLVSMLNPAGAFVQAILAIYNTVTFFIQKINQIAAVVASFIDSIAAIASGQVDNAAKKVEQTMANTLVVIIAFLAKFAGLGNIPEKLVGIVKKIRQPIDKGLDKIVGWLGNLLKKLVGAVKSGVRQLLEWWKREQKFSVDGEAHRLFFAGDAKSAQLRVASDEKSLDDFLKDTKAAGGADATALAAVTAAQNQIKTLRGQRKPPTPDAADPVVDPKIEDQFKIIAAQLPKLFSGDAWGTEANPVLLAFPKKSASLYRTIYLGPRVSGRLAQSVLQARVGKTGGTPAPGFKKEDEIKPTAAALDAWIANGGIVRSYQPFNVLGWPDGKTYGGSGRLGVASQFLAQVGTAFNYEKGTTPGGKKLNEALKKFGFYGRKDGGENSDGDHILEAQLIGRATADQIPNMWPLDKTENRHGENLETNADVSVSGRPTLKFKGLLAASTSTDAKKSKRKAGLRVMIKSTA